MNHRVKLCELKKIPEVWMFPFAFRARSVAALFLTLVVPVMTAWAQENHVVPLSELHRQTAAATEARQANLARLEKFFTSERVQESLRTAKLDGHQVVQALPLMNDEELAKLSAQADRAQADFSAGALSNQQLTYIIIALGTAVVVMLIVLH